MLIVNNFENKLSLLKYKDLTALHRHVKTTILLEGKAKMPKKEKN